MTNDAAKSTSEAATAASGTSSRGKYTFVITDVLFTRLLPALFSAFWKYVHGRRPTNAKIAYGCPFDGTSARLPKKIVKITVDTSGCRIAHDTPRAVCL